MDKSVYASVSPLVHCLSYLPQLQALWGSNHVSQYLIEQEPALWDSMYCHSRNHSGNPASSAGKTREIFREILQFREFLGWIQNTQGTCSPETDVMLLCLLCSNFCGSHLPSLGGMRLWAVIKVLNQLSVSNAIQNL